MRPFRLTRHAEEECVRRRIPIEAVAEVMENPQQVVSGYGGRKVLQSRVDFGGREQLLRVVVDDLNIPAVVLTVYRTSKIDKYWSAP